MEEEEGHVARLEEYKKKCFKILAGKPTEKRPLGGLGVDWRTLLEWILNK